MRPSPARMAGTQAGDLIRIAELVRGQLRQLRPEYDDATAYARTDAILMNGHTDQPSELFTQATFTAVHDYPRAHHLGGFSFWSLNRDRACTRDQPGPVRVHPDLRRVHRLSRRPLGTICCDRPEWTERVLPRGFDQQRWLLP